MSPAQDAPGNNGPPGERYGGGKPARKRSGGKDQQKPLRLRRLGEKSTVAVQAARDGRPLRIDGREVEAIVETWLLEDRWWTDQPLRRRMWEVVTVQGRVVVVYRDLVSNRWWRSR